MGGKSSSSSSSSVTNETNNFDGRVAVEAGGIGVGADAEVTFTDHGVIDGAAGVLEIGLGAMEGIISAVTKFAADQTKQNTDILAEQVESDTKEIGRLAIYAMAFIGVMVLAMAIFIGNRK